MHTSKTTRVPLFLVILFISLCLLFLGAHLAFALNTNSIDFENNDDQYLTISDANQTGLDVTDEFSVEAWVKSESNPTNWPDGRVILSKHETRKGYELLYWYLNGTYYLGLVVGDGTTDEYYYASSSPILPTGEWYHVAATFDPSTEMKLYIDGTEVYDDTSGIGGGPSNSSIQFSIAARADTSLYFDGTIDEVRVWNDIRTGTEISNNYNKEISATSSDLVGYWKLNGNYEDATSNNNDLTNHNCALFTADVPFTDNGC